MPARPLQQVFIRDPDGVMIEMNFWDEPVVAKPAPAPAPAKKAAPKPKASSPSSSKVSAPAASDLRADGQAVGY